MVSLGQAPSLRRLMLQSLSLETGQGKPVPVWRSDEGDPTGIEEVVSLYGFIFFLFLWGIPLP